MSDLVAQKQAVASAALKYVARGEVLGVGTGSTVDEFINLLGSKLEGVVSTAVSSSKASTIRLRELGIETVTLDAVDRIGVYVDGADEFNSDLALIKGGGAALTGEKIVASVSELFVCIVDGSKRVDTLGCFPLPVEVLPMAQGPVMRGLKALGGNPVLRDGIVTDHGNLVVDVHDLRIEDPAALEVEIETTPGVVTCGIFARRRADVVIVSSSADVVETLTCGPGVQQR